MTDNQLLEAWAVNRSDAAFAELLRRYVDLVYSAALRQAGDCALAEDVVQAVFLVLARKAGSLPARCHPGRLALSNHPLHSQQHRPQ